MHLYDFSPIFIAKRFLKSPLHENILTLAAFVWFDAFVCFLQRDCCKCTQIMLKTFIHCHCVNNTVLSSVWWLSKTETNFSLQTILGTREKRLKLNDRNMFCWGQLNLYSHYQQIVWGPVEPLCQYLYTDTCMSYDLEPVELDVNSIRYVKSIPIHPKYIATALKIS